MCFSAPVSFAASALLLPAGFYRLRLASQNHPGYLPLAAILSLLIVWICQSASTVNGQQGVD